MSNSGYSTALPSDRSGGPHRNSRWLQHALEAVECMGEWYPSAIPHWLGPLDSPCPSAQIDVSCIWAIQLVHGAVTCVCTAGPRGMPTRGHLHPGGGAHHDHRCRHPRPGSACCGALPVPPDDRLRHSVQHSEGEPLLLSAPLFNKRAPSPSGHMSVLSKRTFMLLTASYGLSSLGPCYTDILAPWKLQIKVPGPIGSQEYRYVYILRRKRKCSSTTRGKGSCLA
jgi:hypothetical protein